MTSESHLVQQLVEAHRNARHDVDPAPYAALDRAAAYRVQVGTMQALGERPGLYKTGVAPDGVGIVAPIYASNVGQTGVLTLPAAKVIGVEVEVAAVLSADITADMDDADIVECIDHYIVGIEVCGTRYTDRAAAGPAGSLADGMSALGYVINPAPRESGTDVDHFDVLIDFNGKRIYSSPAKHGFGTVLASLLAYARAQLPAYPLKAGMIVTTGSLCGLVPTSGTGRVTAQLGNHTVAFDIV